MKTSNLKIGVKVRIYQSPLTDQDEEGLATLLRRVDMSDRCEMEHWFVAFKDDDRVVRWVHPRHILKCAENAALAAAK